MTVRLLGLLVCMVAAVVGDEIERIERISAEIAQLRQELEACRMNEEQPSVRPVITITETPQSSECDKEKQALRTSMERAQQQSSAAQSTLDALNKRLADLKKEYAAQQHTHDRALTRAKNDMRQTVAGHEEVIDGLRQKLAAAEEKIASLEAASRRKKAPRVIEKTKTREIVKTVQAPCEDPNPFPKLLKKHN